MESLQLKSCIEFSFESFSFKNGVISFFSSDAFGEILGECLAVAIGEMFAVPTLLVSISSDCNLAMSFSI